MTTYNERLSEYITETFAQEDEALQRIRQETPERGLPAINIQPEEGHFLRWLVRATGAKKVLEIGTLGGYSGTWLAGGLPDDGRLITIELDPDHAQVAREHFEQAGVAERVTIRVGSAHEVLPTLAGDAPFDLIFIDADKSSYQDYLAWAVEHVRVGGTILAHNAFAGGKLLDEQPPILEFNRIVADDARLLSTIYPAGDGTVMAVRLK